jgi:hypothetical protein
MDELKLEVGSNVSGGFELRAQEHKQRVRWRTHLRKMCTRGRNKRGGRPAWADRLGPQLPLSAPAFPSALHARLLLCDHVLHGVAPSKFSHPLLCLHDWSSHLITFLWVTSMLPCLTCFHEIPTKQSFDCSPCLSFACALMIIVGGASRDASWCMCG